MRLTQILFGNQVTQRTRWEYLTLRNRRLWDSGITTGTRHQTGWQESEKSKKKSRRIWKADVTPVKLWSRVMQKMYHIPMSKKGVDLVHEKGGLDEYVWGTTDAEADSAFCFKLKRELRMRIQNKKPFTEPYRLDRYMVEPNPLTWVNPPDAPERLPEEKKYVLPHRRDKTFLGPRYPIYKRPHEFIEKEVQKVRKPSPVKDRKMKRNAK
eukprot:Lithocolla_globosa_v1_NODE_1100_length_2870_cov_54.217052.p2 type:complete len:210 gc:universal NODE_1100_length_2870_cov_54.217052:735-106(-)